MKPTISVIVVTYNQEATIGRTLDSILMQQCHVPYEIVIGEDCSSDQTLAVCEQYAEKHPDKIRLLANASVALISCGQAVSSSLLKLFWE